MEQESKIRVAITQGDTNGVGYEVILKVFSDPNILELCTPIIYGSPKIAAYHRKALNLEVPFTIINRAEEARNGSLNLLTCFDEETKIEFGQPSQEAGAAALKALDRAMTDYRSELYDVLVTAPINKATIQSPGFHFPGHTEYIETSVGEGHKALMILMNETLRVALVTTHLVPRRKKSSCLPSKNWQTRAFRLLDPMLLTVSSVLVPTTILTVYWLCITTKDWPHSRLLPWRVVSTIPLACPSFAPRPIMVQPTI